MPWVKKEEPREGKGENGANLKNSESKGEWDVVSKKKETEIERCQLVNDLLGGNTTELKSPLKTVV